MTEGQKNKCKICNNRWERGGRKMEKGRKVGRFSFVSMNELKEGAIITRAKEVDRNTCLIVLISDATARNLVNIIKEEYQQHTRPATTFLSLHQCCVYRVNTSASVCFDVHLKSKMCGGRVETRLNLLVRFPPSLRDADEQNGPLRSHEKQKGHINQEFPIAGWWAASTVAVVWCVFSMC